MVRVRSFVMSLPAVRFRIPLHDSGENKYIERDGNVHDNINASKWLQDSMPPPPVELKWHTTEQVQ